MVQTLNEAVQQEIERRNRSHASDPRSANFRRHAPRQPLDDGNSEYWRAVLEGCNVSDYVPLVERDQPVCEGCGGMGIVTARVPVGHPDYGRAYTCPVCHGGERAVVDRQRRQRRLDDLFASIRHHQRYEWLTWDHFTPACLASEYPGRRIPIDLAGRWARGEKVDYQGYGETFAQSYPTAFRFEPVNSLVIRGQTGTGKTSLAYVACRERLGRGEVCLFVEFYDLLNLIQAQYGASDSQSYQLLEAAATVPVLVLDDLGNVARREPETEDKCNKLWDIINRRYVQLLPTLITTNLNREQIGDQFGPKIRSRLAEMAVWVEMGGMDLRDIVHGESYDR